MVSWWDGEACPCRGCGAPGACNIPTRRLGQNATTTLLREPLRRRWGLRWRACSGIPKTPNMGSLQALGVDYDASEEEIRSARNFLLQQYAGYEESEEAIEGAYDKIITKSYSHCKKSKINLKSKLKKQVEESPSWVKALLGYFEVPSVDVISRRFVLFGFIAGWSIVTSAETGPTFQNSLRRSLPQ